MAERLARHSLEKAVAAPKQRHGGGKPLERSLVELLSSDPQSPPGANRTKFRNVFSHEGAADCDSNDLLAMKWLEAHWNDVGRIEEDFTLLFGREVAARAVEYCTLQSEGSGEDAGRRKRE